MFQEKNGQRINLLVSVLFLLLASTSVLSAQTDVSALTQGFTWREVGPANPGGRIRKPCTRTPSSASK